LIIVCWWSIFVGWVPDQELLIWLTVWPGNITGDLSIESWRRRTAKEARLAAVIKKTVIQRSTSGQWEKG